jgi:ADP-ribosylglycohydrolase
MTSWLRKLPQMVGEPSVDIRARVRASLVGGAVGDALGASVEFLSWGEVQERFGGEGVSEYAAAYGRLGAITDDTQMTLFTAEGILRAYTRAMAKGICHPPTVVDHAYARWLLTQGGRSGRWKVDRESADGWLAGVEGLYSRRAPGGTCLSALAAAEAGTTRVPINDSKGCGGVMRVAPAGLMGARALMDPFVFGCDVAALTHGHPSGFLAAGALADLLARIVAGTEFAAALPSVLERLASEPGHEEVTRALKQAVASAAEDRRPRVETIERIGGGWVAEEALAIAVYVASCSSTFADGVLAAVNHGGDSDSTGAIAGNLLGAIHGYEAIPVAWLQALELRDEIEALADDWLACLWGDEPIDVQSPDWWARYPGW